MDAWRIGAAGWLRAMAVEDAAAGAVLASRLEELVFPAWRDAGGSAVVGLVEERWRETMRSWVGGSTGR
jgi:hypothetical protein